MLRQYYISLNYGYSKKIVKFIIKSKKFSPININKEKIREILKALRKYKNRYIKDTYIIENISTRNELAHYTFDESDFIKLKGKIWSDIRIFHDFFSDKNYTNQADGYEYLNYIQFDLNGERNFYVDRI